jgi:uncharacterized membrane protein
MGHTRRLAAIGAVTFMVFDASALFVIPRASTVSLAAAYGALFGFVVYGVYDFTNDSTLRQWPFVLTLAHVAWGTVASAAAAVAVRILAR